jgi:hypothetical protein
MPNARRRADTNADPLVTNDGIQGPRNRRQAHATTVVDDDDDDDDDDDEDFDLLSNPHPSNRMYSTCTHRR